MRHKTKYSNRALATAWANRELSRQGSEFHGNSMKANHEAIYSWGYHFCIAKRWRGLVLFTERDYSNSTSRHKRLVLRAIGYNAALHVPDLDSYGGVEHSVPAWISRKLAAAEEQYAKAKRARQNKPWYLLAVIQILNTAAEYAETFNAKLPQRPGWLDAFLDSAVVEVFKAKADGAMSDWRWQNAEQSLTDIKLHPCYGAAK